MAFIARDDPLPRGAWGDITCTLYWCEEKYQWSKWVAEPANTFSSMIFIYLAFYGAYVALKNRLQTRFLVCSFALGIVGLGSVAFHGSLKYEAQMMDEIPMIWAASGFGYSAYETSPGRPHHPILIPAIFIGTSILIPAAYVALNHPVFHQAAYAALLLSAAARVLWLLYSPNSPMDRASPIGMQHTKVARRLLFTGTATFLAGFFIWNMDNVFCQQLRDGRNYLRAHHLSFLAHFLQGHAVWHFFTAVGAWRLIFSLAIVVESVKQGPELWRIGPTLGGLGWIFPSLHRIETKADAKKSK